MEKILGIDLGTNSIGWAIREIDLSLENQIIDKGVLTFDKKIKLTSDKFTCAIEKFILKYILTVK